MFKPTVKEYEVVMLMYALHFRDLEAVGQDVLDVFYKDPDDPNFPSASDYAVSWRSIESDIYSYTIEIRDEDNRVLDSYTEYFDEYAA